MKIDEIDRDRPRLPANKNCHKLSTSYEHTSDFLFVVSERGVHCVVAVRSAGMESWACGWLVALADRRWSMQWSGRTSRTRDRALAADDARRPTAGSTVSWRHHSA